MTFLQWLNSSQYLERTAVVFGDSNSQLVVGGVPRIIEDYAPKLNPEAHRQSLEILSETPSM